MRDYAGKAQVERYAAKTGEKAPGQEQAGGKMAEPGTQSDKTHSAGQLSDAGKAVWQQGVAARGADEREERHDASEKRDMQANERDSRTKP